MRYLAGAFTYLWIGLILVLPVVVLLHGAFAEGIAALWQVLEQPDAVHALTLSLLISLAAVVLNVCIGTLAALWIFQKKGQVARILLFLFDLPMAVSPVIAGLSLVLMYGPESPIGHWLTARNIQVIFAWPGILLATLFVSLPFAIREILPVLSEKGGPLLETATSLGAGPWRTFFRILLPTLRHALVYGIILTFARAIGEFGAVLVVSGNIIGLTQTGPLYIYQSVTDNTMNAAYGVAFFLLFISVITLFSLVFLKERRDPYGRYPAKRKQTLSGFGRNSRAQSGY